ncbi:hemerythrin domain-containing protein [Aquabacterium sp. OR-4]|uniref:hemerythrin domain-containing protein n=1 Tax=Aquabacterium sp. OR-4 TaxID=2978127 RepID=UPI0021B445EE|nr:hemerythrin domain-containing protein [Aquabacterium sp. OR-4]MDT7834678.1 hemerythrin domain-containing protein [Aquabacterium sp. OR-4]
MTARTQRAARPSRSAPPPLPPLEALDRTHHSMMGVLNDLRHLVEHLEHHGVDAAARQSAKAVCAFFSGHARQHHADEEALIFPPLLRKNDPVLTQHVLRLQQDHGWLEEDWLELAPQLQAVAEGYSWYELEALRHGVGVFTTLYHEHIALEESLIYPEARRQMAAEAASRDQRIASA